MEEPPIVCVEEPSLAVCEPLGMKVNATVKPGLKFDPWTSSVCVVALGGRAAGKTSLMFAADTGTVDAAAVEVEGDVGDEFPHRAAHSPRTAIATNLRSNNRVMTHSRGRASLRPLCKSLAMAGRSVKSCIWARSRQVQPMFERRRHRFV